MIATTVGWGFLSWISVVPSLTARPIALHINLLGVEFAPTSLAIAGGSPDHSSKYCAPPAKNKESSASSSSQNSDHEMYIKITEPQPPPVAQDITNWHGSAQSEL